jgi:phage terminase Nu1 subunit (DNA packaging protein)
MGYRDHHPQGIDIFSADWDNMIILDSCRFDIFEEESSMPGTLEKRTSRGSMSEEFIVGNFTNKTLHDLVYISGNSWYARKCKSINAEVHHYSLIDSEYPEKTEEITEQAKEAIDNYPNKRLIVHYMLPHFPYIGNTARKYFPSIDTQRERFFADLRSGHVDITDAQLKKAYRENLRIVLPDVSELLDILSGKTVVTADHGELLGERTFPIPYREYSHPKRMYVPQLVEVPWLVHENGEKEIESEPPAKDNLSGIAHDEVRNNLRELGYIR